MIKVTAQNIIEGILDYIDEQFEALDLNDPTVTRPEVDEMIANWEANRRGTSPTPTPVSKQKYNAIDDADTVGKSPADENWYVEDAGNAGQFVPALDTTPQPGTTYYVLTQYTFTAVAAANLTGKNPATEGWYVEDATAELGFVVTTDTAPAAGKKYYTCVEKNIPALTPIFMVAYDPVDDADTVGKDPSSEGWYVEDTVNVGEYVLTADTDPQAGTTYYTRTDYSYTPLAAADVEGKNPSTEGWFVEDASGVDGFAASTDTAPQAGVTYYVYAVVTP